MSLSYDHFKFYELSIAGGLAHQADKIIACVLSSIHLVKTAVLHALMLSCSILPHKIVRTLTRNQEWRVWGRIKLNLGPDNVEGTVFENSPTVIFLVFSTRKIVWTDKHIDALSIHTFPAQIRAEKGRTWDGSLDADRRRILIFSEQPLFICASLCQPIA